MPLMRNLKIVFILLVWIPIRVIAQPTATNPVAPGESASAKSLNRRVEIYIE